MNFIQVHGNTDWSYEIEYVMEKVSYKQYKLLVLESKSMYSQFLAVNQDIVFNLMWETNN